MKFACLLCTTMSLGHILPNSNLQRPRRLDPKAAPQQPKKRFHRFGGAVLSPQLRWPRTWLHWSAFLAVLWQDRRLLLGDGICGCGTWHGQIPFATNCRPTMTDKECPKQWRRRATDYWKYVRTECFLNEKELSTARHSCALRLPALFLDTREGCINLLLSRLAAGCSLGLAKSKMRARAGINKTGQRMHASTHTSSYTLAYWNSDLQPLVQAWPLLTVGKSSCQLKIISKWLTMQLETWTLFHPRMCCLLCPASQNQAQSSWNHQKSFVVGFIQPVRSKLTAH